MISYTGCITQGYQIASKGATKLQVLPSNVYNNRSILVSETVHRQLPFFAKAGVPNIINMHGGTINVDISPALLDLSLGPDYKVTCEWIDGIRESFCLTKAEIFFEEKYYQAYIYYPEVSDQHSRRDNIIELIANKIPNITYGKKIIINIP